MSSFLERLRRALAPHYEVERELSGGGMGLVFLGRDVALDRAVAIKVMRPELATAQAAERFLREARILAQLSHPNVVPVYQTGEADGFFYYTMEYVQGETLAERLARGPLSTDEARKMGRDLLDGLEAAHRAGIVHRDIKPSNVFLIDGRALLGDFGVATPVSRAGPPTTAPGAAVGTPGYMPPEQAVGGPVTPQTDLYAVGMILYEALTGRRWPMPTAPERADWSGVPARLRPALKRALAWAPEDRWPDAASFRRPLWRTRTRRYLERTIGLAAALFLAGVVVARQSSAVCEWPVVSRLCGAPPPSVLAIPPFRLVETAGAGAGAGAGSDGEGAELARLTRHHLDGLPNLTLTPVRAAAGWYARVDPRPGEIPIAEFARLRAQYVAWADVYRRGDSLEVRLRVFEGASGRPRPGEASVRGPRSDRVGLAERAANAILPILGELPPLCDRIHASREFVLGEHAFQRNAWREAVRHYEAAIDLDPECGQAWWRAWNAWQWLGWGTDYPKTDLATIRREYGDRLREQDRLLIEAELAPPGRARLERYEALRARYPDDVYAAFLHAEEIFVRGPLVGLPLERAQLALEEVAARDSLLSPAHTYLTMVRIRLGRREAARRALDHLWRIAAPPEQTDVYVPPLLDHAFLERFEPERAAARRASLFEGPDGLSALTFAVRFGLWFDQPQTELALGALLAGAEGAPAFARASGHEAQGLARVASGRPVAALAHFDSAAAILATPEARLQAAEWRVVPRALGVPGFPEGEAARGRRDLEGFLNDPARGPRAAWALALDAHARGDTAAASRWLARVERAAADTSAAQLARLLDGVGQAAAGAYAAALRTTEPLVPYYVLRKGDPFARAVLHLKRGEWRAALGDGLAADAEWLWYENQDLIGYPRDEAQAAEVDWSLGAHARRLRGRAALRRGDRAAACTHLARAAELWWEGEPGAAEAARDARAGAGEACSP